MKITVKPTDSNRPTIELEYQTDNMDIDSWVEAFKVILKAWTFTDETIEEAFNSE